MPDTIRTQFSDEFARLEQFLAFAQEDFQNQDGFTLTREHHDGFYVLVLGWMTKAHKTARAIMVLCEKGLGTDAEALLRVLVETMVNLLYLCDKDEDERAIWFFAYQAIEKKKMVGLLRKARYKSIYAQLDPAKEEEIQEVYEAAVERRNMQGKNWFQRIWFWVRVRFARWDISPELWPSSNSWSGEHVARMAKKVKAPAFYDLPYRQASAVIHGTDLENHIVLADPEKTDLTKGVKFIAPYDDNHIAHTLTTATLAIDQILHVAYKVLQFKRLPELEALSKRVVSSIPRVGPV